MIVGGSSLGAGVWDSLVTAGRDLLTKDLPAAAKKAVMRKAAEVSTPIAERLAARKTSEVVSKGNVIALAAGGAAVGALITGGGWQRRMVGGLVVGGLGALAGLKIGLLIDSM